MMRSPGIRSAVLSILAVLPGFGAALASERVVAGRVIDSSGAAVPGAAILVFPAGRKAEAASCQGGSRDRSAVNLQEPAPEPARLRSDARGAFSALLPEGRFVVAAMKRGYEISVTEIYAGASRILRMRMQPSGPGVHRTEPRDVSWAEADWFLRRRRADVLREEEASVPQVALVARAPEHAGASFAGQDRRHTLLGPVDGDFAHSFGAGDLLRLVDRTGGADGGARTTALELRAPLSPDLSWNLEGSSARTRIGLPDGVGRLAGGSDQIGVGVDYSSTEGGGRLGMVRAWFGAAAAGAGRIDQSVVEASGEMALTASGRRLAVGVRAWDGEADLADGAFLSLDGAASVEPDPGRIRGEGLGVYTGEHLPLGELTRLDYGIEYRADSLSGEARAVPRLGVRRMLPALGAAGMAIRSDLLIDPGRPGGILAIEAAPIERLQVSARVSFLPAYALVEDGSGRSGRPAGRGPQTPGRRSSDTREIDLAVAGDFGALGGSLSGSVGRAGPRDLPVIEEGPLLLVSFGSERFYETRLGVDYKPWDARVEVGYLRVESEAPREGGAPPEAPLDYGRLDLLLSKVLPSPPSLLGARLRALVEWQGLGYDSVLAAQSGASISGVTSRLSGGVGLTF